MKNKCVSRRKIVITAVLICFCVLWAVRFISLNRYYSQFVTPVRIISAGQKAAFGDNYLSFNAQAKGCTVEVTGAQYQDSIGQYTGSASVRPEHVLLVGVRFYNNTDRDCRVDCSEFTLSGRTWTAPMENAASQSNVSVKARSETDVTLVFDVFKETMRERTWKSLSGQKILLGITQRPVAIKMEVEMP